MSNYILQVGSQGSSRLERINNICGPYSQRFLTSTGLTQGITVLEIGCGTGNMTTWIAQQVGPTGSVIAVDISDQQLEIAKHAAEKQGLNNIEFIHSPIEEFTLDAPVDMIYSRFVLMHLTQPTSTINKLKLFLKPNGIIACEEPAFTSIITAPRHDIIEKLTKLSFEWGKKHGCDYDLGDKLYSMINALEFDIEHALFYQPIIPMQDAIALYVLQMQESADNLIQDNLATAAETEAMLNQLQRSNTENQGYYAFARMLQIAAKR